MFSFGFLHSHFPIYDEADIFVQSREDINLDHRLDSALFFEIGVQ
jgi:hypothetical protein